jgi:hypothetical protein
LPTSKKIYQVKKSSSPTIWHISLAKPRSNIKNPERNKIIFIPLHLLKTYIMNPSLFFISFSPSHLQGNADGNHDPRAHICVWGSEFCQVLFLSSWFIKLLEANFSCFAKIIWMSNWFAKLLELL